MVSQKNINKVEELVKILKESKAVILADLSGLSVAKQIDLRQKVNQAGGRLLVTKNTLFSLALKKLLKTIPEEISANLQGPTAFLFVHEDEILSIKTLVGFAEDNGMPKTKIGLILEPDDRVLPLAEIELLATLPGREQIIYRLVSALKTPQYRLVNSLSADIMKLLNVLSAIKDRQTAELAISN